MTTVEERIVRRFLAFKYQPKEKKKAKVDRLMRFIRDETGESRGVATEIADAIVRGRDVERLALQKGWPLDGSKIIGPQGDLSVERARAEL